MMKQYFLLKIFFVLNLIHVLGESAVIGNQAISINKENDAVTYFNRGKNKTLEGDYIGAIEDFT